MGGAKLDLVIVGGGPAGTATALYLQHYAPDVAARTVVLERERYPRDKYCAGAIGGRGLRLLEDIGVRAHEEVPSLPIHAVSLHMGGERWVLREPDMGCIVRRLEFDHALAREAMRRGIEVREATAVTAIETSSDGVTVRLASGESLEARAVVGADGVGGIVRRSAGFGRGSLRAQVIELDTEPAPDDPPPDAIHFDFRYGDLRGYAWDFPTLVDGEKMWCRGVYRIVNGDTDDVRARLATFLAEKGLDIGRYKLKPFAERGFEPGSPISKPRVLLVGEAAGIDIATGEGIAQALQYGALAGDYLARAFEDADFRFSDWPAKVQRDSVGRQLRQRLLWYDRFYGKHRPRLEKELRRTPAALRLGMLQFAGKSMGAAGILRAAAETVPAAARLGLRAVLRMLGGRANSGSGAGGHMA